MTPITKDYITEDQDFDFIKTGKTGLYNVAIGALITNENNQVLLTKRPDNNTANPGTWELVWGRIDQGESLEEGLYREVSEETGLIIHPYKIIATTHFMRTPKEPEHIGIVFWCKVDNSQQVAPNKAGQIADWEWSSIDDALQKVTGFNKPHLNFVKNAIS